MRAKGFTLIELLVVISILAILAVVGATLYSSVSKSSRDAKRKADIEAIAKAYETSYQSGSYQTLTASNFASGTIPQDPAGGNYYANITSGNLAFRVCTALESNPLRTCSSPSSNCYCLSSTQGSYTSGSGGSIDHPSSCDPNGTLSYGLVGYWDFNDSVADRSGKGNNGILNGGVLYSTDVSPSGIFGKSGFFDGVDDYVRMNLNPYPILSTIHGPSSVSLWFKVNSLIGNKTLFSDNCAELGIMQNTSTMQGLIYNSASIYSGAITAGGWHHAVITHEHPAGLTGTKARFYLDGAQQGSTITYDITTQNGYLDNPFYIGNDACNSGRLFNGYIDDVRLYNRALSSEEILALNSGCLPQ